MDTRKAVICFLAEMVILSACGRNEFLQSEKNFLSPVRSDIAETDSRYGKRTIDYICQDHRFTQEDGEGNVMVEANYFTFELDEDAAGRYPQLVARLEEYNREAKTETDKEVESLIIADEGNEQPLWQVSPYLIWRQFEPVRTDGDIFSFTVKTYEFSGGMHGYVVWRSLNIDSVTGADIPFRDVVRNTEGLSGIIVDELKRNHEIGDYFDRNPETEEDVRKYIEEYKLPDDAKDFTWAIAEDGVYFYFNDYELGSYSAGAYSVLVPYARYPEVFGNGEDQEGNRRYFAK